MRTDISIRADRVYLFPEESGRTYLNKEDIINLSNDYDNATGVFVDDGDRDDDYHMMVKGGVA